MDDPFLVCVLYAKADVGEERKPLRDREPLLIAVLGDRSATYELHDEVGVAGFGGPGVVNAGDIRMFHQGEGLALGFETRDDLLGIHSRLDDLECHPAAHRGSLFSQVNDAHSAFAKRLQQLVRPDDGGGDLSSGERTELVGHGQCR